MSELCYYNFPKKSLDKLNVDERTKKLKNEKQINVEDYNIFLRRGTFVKREVESYTNCSNLNCQDCREQNGKCTKGKKYWRNNYVRFALPDLKCSEDYIELLDCKNFEQWEFHEIEFELLNQC